MEDTRELLELAAKAVGYQLISWQNNKLNVTLNGKNNFHWNPLTDDGDALRLAVNLGLIPQAGRLDGCCVVTSVNDSSMYIVESFADDPYAATRRAIVRAAAAIGKRMEDSDETRL